MSICATFVVISLTVFRYCVDNAGEDVQILVEAATTGAESTPTGTAEHSDGHSDGHASEEPAGSGEHCHDHAGIPYVKFLWTKQRYPANISQSLRWWQHRGEILRCT